jgi:hypothetical protein
MPTDLDEKYVVPASNHYASSSAMCDFLNLKLLSTLDACFARLSKVKPTLCNSLFVEILSGTILSFKVIETDHR